MSHSKSKRSMDNKSEMVISTSFKWNLPTSCFITLMKRILIDKLPGKYFIASHPYPRIEGQLFVLQPKKEDQASKDSIIYRDYSLRKRLETSPPEMPSSTQRGKKKS